MLFLGLKNGLQATSCRAIEGIAFLNGKSCNCMIAKFPHEIGNLHEANPKNGRSA